jgi:hypothetical protein
MRASLILSLLFCLPSTLVAQRVTGRVLDRATRAPVAGADARLLDQAGQVLARAVTAEAGTFRLDAPQSGEYVVEIVRLGYADTRTPRFALRPGEEVLLDVLMGVDAVPLDSIAVISRRMLGAQDYLARAEWVRRTGLGRVITREEIESRPRAHLSEYLAGVPGVRVRGAAPRASVRMAGVTGDCQPSIYLDGVPAPGFDLDAISPRSVEGVEIYRSAGVIPAEFRGDGRCGVIAITTRRGERIPGRMTRLQKIVAGVIATGFVVLLVTRN